MGGIYDWSQPHAKRVRQIASKVKSYMPLALPFIMKYVIPLVANIFEEDLDKMMDPQKLMSALPKVLNLIPKKIKTRRSDT